MQNMDKNSKTKITNGLGILKRFRLDACTAFESLTVEIRSKDMILVFVYKWISYNFIISIERHEINIERKYIFQI